MGALAFQGIKGTGTQIGSLDRACGFQSKGDPVQCDPNRETARRVESLTSLHLLPPSDFLTILSADEIQKEIKMATEFPDAVHRGQPARRQSGTERGEMFLETQMEDIQPRPQGFFHQPRLSPPWGDTGANTKAQSLLMEATSGSAPRMAYAANSWSPFFTRYFARMRFRARLGHIMCMLNSFVICSRLSQCSSPLKGIQVASKWSLVPSCRWLVHCRTTLTPESKQQHPPPFQPKGARILPVVKYSRKEKIKLWEGVNIKTIRKPKYGVQKGLSCQGQRWRLAVRGTMTLWGQSTEKTSN